MAFFIAVFPPWLSKPSCYNQNSTALGRQNMRTLFEQVLASSKSLTADERARLAHALIASLDQQQDDDAEQRWLAVTEQRIGEIEAGYVTGVSWQEIKQQLGEDQSK